ncbi:MAG: hypothetical protein SGBAC_000986 [Bacillariaceae sp.]
MPPESFPTVDIDLTLESIEGIEWHSEADNWDDIPKLKASVSFAGSPRNMRVSSFTMCGRTGNLVVESGSLEVKQTMSNGRFSMGADFGNTNVDFSRNQSSLTESSSASTSLPHLRLDSSLKSLATASTSSMSIEEANREFSTLPNGRICVDSNPGIEVDACGTVDASQLLMEESLEWERYSSNRPDVVDINISLQSEENEIVAEGVAHLVLYGMPGDSAVTILDLRLKEKNILNLSIPEGSAFSTDSEDSSILFGANASIRVQLTTIADNVESLDESIGSRTSSIQTGKVHIGNLKERMKGPEILQRAREKAAKHDENPSMAPGGVGEDLPRSGFFCNGGDLTHSLSYAFGFDKKRPSMAHNLRSNLTFDSTIITRESLLI